MTNGKSEVARLLAQIDAEYAAARRGLSGLSQGTAQHEVITAKMERIAGYHKEIGEIVGSDVKAMEILVQHIEKQEWKI